MHNYRSNQSAFMTRFGTDLRHQYGIFGGKSQTSFSRIATRPGSEEGRLFSHAIFTVKIATDLACAQRWYPCNTSGFWRQCYSSPQGPHLPIYANSLWFSVSFAKLRPSGPALNFLPLPPPLRRRMHLSSISVLRPSASAKSRFP